MQDQTIIIDSAGDEHWRKPHTESAEVEVELNEARRFNR